MGRQPVLVRVRKTLVFMFFYMFYAFWVDLYRFLMAPKKSVAAQVVVVTGGAMGIGRRLAEKLCFNEGAIVAILDVNQKEAEMTVHGIRKRGGNAHFYVCDVVNSEQLVEVAAKIDNQLGKVSMIVCNAGILKIGLFMEIGESGLRRSFDVNVIGVYNTIRAFLEPMIGRNSGHIVVMGSLCSFYGAIYGPAYCLTKFAVRGLFESLQDELNERGLTGVKSTIVFPYFADTSLVSDNGNEPTSTFFNVLTMDEIADGIIDAIKREKITVYIPWSLVFVCNCLRTIYDLAFKPDGSELLVAADAKVLVYDGNDGTLLKPLSGHKDLVYCVSFSHNGDRFASGSADHCVIIWTEQHEATLKYSHNDAIQCVEFSPVVCILLSGAIGDFGIWRSAQKSVTKQKLASRCTACAWSPNGQLYSIGMFNGTFCMRSADTNDELWKIERTDGEPIWAICFSVAWLAMIGNLIFDMKSCTFRGRYFSTDDKTTGNRRSSLIEAGDASNKMDILAVSDWNQSIGFYDMHGNLLNGYNKQLDFDPCGMDNFNNGEFLLIAGSNRKVLFLSRQAITTKLTALPGTNLGIVAQMDAWVWTIKVKPGTNAIVVGCVDGTLACYQLIFSTVHGLYKGRYGFRDNMTDVVVRDLDRNLQANLLPNSFSPLVFHIQLSDRVLIYRQISGDDDNEQLDYGIIEKLFESFDCSLLVVCAQHLILCQEKRLQCVDFKGLKQREWSLASSVRYIKVVGGPAGNETILVGLRNGQISNIFVDNPFPVHLVKIKNCVRSVDISHLKRKLAIIDENSLCSVYDVKTKDLLFQEPNANSVAFNSDNEDLLCFSGNGSLSIKVHNFPAYQQQMQGFVVGFSGKRVFFLHLYTIAFVEIPLSNQLYQYLERGLYK